MPFGKSKNALRVLIIIPTAIWGSQVPIQLIKKVEIKFYTNFSMYKTVAYMTERFIENEKKFYEQCHAHFVLRIPEIKIYKI